MICIQGQRGCRDTAVYYSGVNKIASPHRRRVGWGERDVLSSLKHLFSSSSLTDCRKVESLIHTYFLLQHDNSDMTIFKFFSVLQCQGGQVRLNITIHPSKIKVALMKKYGQNFPSLYFMSMSVYNLVGLRSYGKFYTGVISHFHQQ